MEQVQMSAEERKEFEAFKAEREKKRREEERKQQRQEYATLVDEEIGATIPRLREVSEMLKKAKDEIFRMMDFNPICLFTGIIINTYNMVNFDNFSIIPETFFYFYLYFPYLNIHQVMLVDLHYHTSNSYARIRSRG